jgi:ribosomal protein L13E
VGEIDPAAVGQHRGVKVHNDEVPRLTMTRIGITLVAASLALPSVATGQAPRTAQVPPYVYRTPARTGDGWEVADLRKAGIDSARMVDLVAAIRRQELPNLHSVLVLTGGKLVFEGVLFRLR